MLTSIRQEQRYGEFKTAGVEEVKSEGDTLNKKLLW